MSSPQRSPDVIQKMFNEIAPSYDLLNRILSFRQDVYWRNKMLSQLRRHDKITILDVACGTGDVLLQAHKKNKNIEKFIGLDISDSMLSHFQEKIKDKIPKNEQDKFQLIHGSAEKIELESETVDTVSISFGLRNVENREKALKEFYRVLKKSGDLFILEFFQPPKKLFSSLFQFYFHKWVPIVGRILSGHKTAYRYLPQSVKSMPPSEDFQKTLSQMGFHPVSYAEFLFGGVHLIHVCKK